MRFFGVALLLLSANTFATVEKTGSVKSVQLWGAIAKAKICSGENACTSFWVSLGDIKGQAVLSMWLAAKMAGNRVYIQGYDPDKPERPYSNASKFYGMNLD
ncbi:hypothetical protein [Marinagarivorans algicola]|uniref:hypothetical protein n=1 Tax=Marinagarivorans algicola TaxID=1513270 RepID=UPI0006B8F9FF|nr:hypothetical protein [Marinagarivorans algicola]